MVNELEEKIEFHSIVQPNVSSASVGWHIEHSLLALDTSLRALQKSDPKEYKWTFNLWRILILFYGKIPRGKGKAPKAVQPAEMLDEITLVDHVNRTKLGLEKLSSLGRGQFMKHPYFGHLRLSSAKRFMEMHTHHHLKIINDILNSHS